MKTIGEVLKTRRYGWLFLLLLISRTGYLYIYGIYAEPETEAWLSGFSVQHPPLYPLILQGLTGLYPSAWLVSGLQILVYSFSLSLLAAVLFNSDRLFYVFAAICSVEPTTAQYTASISPIAFFLSFIFLTLAFFHIWLRNPGAILWGGIILFSSLTFLLRYQGLILPLMILIYILGFPAHRRYYLITALIFAGGFQLVLLPFRFMNFQKHETWRLNAYTGMSLWNNVSVLYCTSAVRVNPRSGFETFAAYKPCGQYTQENAIRGWHLSEPASTLNMYQKRKVKSVKEGVAFGDQLFRSSLSIIIQHPVDYLTRFVWPNFMRIMQEEELREIYPKSMEKTVKEKLNLPGPAYVYFNPYVVWLACGLFLFNLLFQLYYHNSLGFISLFNMGYMLSVMFMGPLRSGDFLLLIPLICLNMIFLWDKLFYRNIYFRFAYRGL